MARRKNGTAPEEQKAAFVFRGYVRCEFAATDKPDVRKWLEGRTESDMVTDLCVLAEDGYKVSVGPTTKGFVATMANVEAVEAYRGYMMSAFAADPQTAFHALCYKHLVLLDRDWGQVTDSDDDLLR